MPFMEWIDRAEVSGMFSSEYWNSVEEEKSKAWNVETPSQIGKLKSYIESNGFLDEYRQAERWMKQNAVLHGRVLDVAAGVCWTSALLSRVPEVSAVDALDFSYHRIHDIAPNVIAGLDGIDEKINRIFGSFYELRTEEHYDVIFMSQAFHHADRPFYLLHACDQKLRSGGVMVLLGEHNITPYRMLRSFVSVLLKKRRFPRDYFDMFPADAVSGDHYYRLSDYRFMFGALGYSVEIISANQTLVLAALKE